MKVRKRVLDEQAILENKKPDDSTEKGRTKGRAEDMKLGKEKEQAEGKIEK